MRKIFLISGALTLLICFRPQAQTSLQKVVVSNGGGALSSTNSDINLTISQSAVGQVMSQDKGVHVGFWFMRPESDQEVSIAIYLTESISGPKSRTFPNPFRERITFYLRLTQREKVRIAIYSLDGKIIEEICDEWIGAGISLKEWVPRGLSEGQYIAKLSTSNGYTKISPIILVR